MFGNLKDKLKDAAKDAAEDIQKAVKTGDVGDAAKKALDSVPGKAPEQLIQALRELLAKAKALLAKGDNKPLQECVDKASKLLEDKDVSAPAVTRITAELTALLKGAGDAKPASKSQPAASAAPAASKPAASAAKPAAPVQRSAPAAKPEVKAAPKKNFTDVKEGAFYYDAVQWAVEKGIASGTSDNTFSPDDTCSRGQMITFLWRAAGSPAPRSKANPFEDVKEGAYYYDAARWAAEHGVATGKTFSPDSPCTRAQVATFLYRNAGSPAVHGESGFIDVHGDADYHDAVTWVAEKKITAGTSETTFSPDAPCSRGQIVTFLYRAK